LAYTGTIEQQVMRAASGVLLLLAIGLFVVDRRWRRRHFMTA
jgi:hypothetical protein